MGHFFQVPIGPIAGATAAQPYAGQKLPPSLEIVPNPPFRQRSRTQEIISENAALAQPDPWVHVYEAIGGRPGPFMPATLTPSLLIVPNPPFVSVGRQAWTVYEEAFSRQPDPWPYVYTSAQPYARGPFFTPSGAVVVTPQGPYANLWMASVIQSWFADPPRPVLQPQLAPGIPGQSVDNPPAGFRQFNPPYPDVYVTPQPQRFTPPPTAVVVQTYTPYSNVWVGTVVQSWFVDPPRPQQPTYSNSSNLIVPNPPFGVSPSPVWGFSPGYVPVPYSGFTVSGPVPPVQVIYKNQWISGILQQWQPPDPLPTLPRNLNPSQLIVPNPPIIGSGPTSLWQNSIFAQPDPWPYVFFDTTTGAQPYVGPTPTPPPTVIVIPQGPYANLWMASVVQSWFGPDPSPILPRYLNPSQLVVPNPPTVQPTQLPGIIAYWQPPDPSPTQPRALVVQPFIPPPVNNPPFTGRSELANVLAQWAAWPPSLWPTPYSAPPQVQPGPTPPPPTPATTAFTVSGPGVNVFLVEFAYDVVYEDAPITKRTL